MRFAISVFRLESRALPKRVPLAADNEKFPAYNSGLSAGVKNEVADSEIAISRPCNSEPNAPSFCKIINEVVPALPTGQTSNPVGSREKKSDALLGIGSINSELP